jgi:hypothetical protein
VICVLVHFTGLNWRGSTVVGLALALSATAIALQILEERGQLQQTYAQRALAILLFQDITIVPVLALAAAARARQRDAGGELDRGADGGGLGRGRDRRDRVYRPLSAHPFFGDWPRPARAK